MTPPEYICEPCGLEKLPETDGPAIRLVDVEKTLDGRKVLNGVNLEIPRQRITVIIGLSGAGKSVMLKHMIGLTKPDRGQVLVEGVDINRLRKWELYKVRKRFGMLFQGGALFDSLTVFENVAFPLREKTFITETEIGERVHALLGQVGLDASADKFPDELSGGMQRRVALARAMVMDPEIILFDEPTTGLDPIIRHSVLNLIGHTYHQHGFTMVMISHDLPDIFRYCHHVVVLYEGRIIASAPTEEFLKSDNPVVRQMLHGDTAGPVHM